MILIWLLACSGPGETDQSRRDEAQQRQQRKAADELARRQADGFPAAAPTVEALPDANAPAPAPEPLWLAYTWNELVETGCAQEQVDNLKLPVQIRALRHVPLANQRIAAPSADLRTLFQALGFPAPTDTAAEPQLSDAEVVCLERLAKREGALREVVKLPADLEAAFTADIGAMELAFELFRPFTPTYGSADPADFVLKGQTLFVMEDACEDPWDEPGPCIFRNCAVNYCIGPGWGTPAP